MLSCNKAIDESANRKAILALQEQERTAHFNNDADLFVSEFAPALYMLNKGKVDSSSVEVYKKKIQSYFNTVKFIKWDDVAEPIIQFSKDHSMAYAIIQKQVILEAKDSTGKTVNDTTDYAWTSIYRKLNNKWKLVCNTSTNK
jgi:hypothetical protein